MGKLYDIVQRRIDQTGVTEATLAKRMGSKPQTLNSWKKRGLRRLPEKHLLVALARETVTPYREVLEAALHDIRYLPEDAVPLKDGSPPTQPEVALAAMSGTPDHMPDTETGEESQDPGSDEPA